VVTLCLIVESMVLITSAPDHANSPADVEARPMKPLNVPCFLIDKTRRDTYLQDGYTPLRFATKDQELLHRKEWKAVLMRLEAALSPYWKDGIGDGDFYLDADVVNDRFHCVEVSREVMLSGRLLKIVHDVVVNSDHPYSVDICDSRGYLKTIAGEAYPHFNIFVERDRILIFSESRELLEKLGLADVPALEGQNK
jgi:hypothetical protein